MTTLTCHECGHEMTPGLRPMTIHYRGLSATVDAPGWYCRCGEGRLTSGDTQACDEALSLLKAHAEALSAPNRHKVFKDSREPQHDQYRVAL